MTAVVDKTVRIATERAQRLEQVAAACGQTEDTLIEEGLDLLFRKLDQQSIRAEMTKEDQGLLAQMEAELGPIQRPGGSPIALEGARLIAGTAVLSGWGRHSEEQH
jgi:hypothetical protein